MEEAQIIDIDKYKLRKNIGSGASGFVQLVEEVETGKLYAMKVIRNNNINMKEINSYKKIDNPAILKFRGYNMSKNKLVLLLDYMPNGSLENILNYCRCNKRPINFTQTKKYLILKGIAYGMKYLHSQSIIHRDLKTDNILLDENFYPKICDFGISYVSDIPCSTIRMKEFVGTPLYKSPEIINRKSYSYKIDIYSFALIAYELITEKIPFQNLKRNQVYENVTQGIRPDLSGIDVRIQDFFLKCWSNDPLKRPTFDDIIDMINEQHFRDFFQVDETENFLYESNFNDYKEALEILKNFEINKAIIEGNHKGIYLYGLAHLRGLLNYDKSAALRYIKIAADKGNIDAMYNYACLLEKSEDQSKKREIVKYLKLAADNGNIDSMITYAIKIFYGQGIPENKNEGKKYLKRAADLGNSNAMCQYGLVLMEENEKNAKEAAKYLKKSADLFNMIAMLYYGNMLVNGDGINIDIDIGIDYIKRSADQGYVDSMYYYAAYLYNGEIIPINKKEAARYFKMAANQGHGDSAYFYARMLYHGNGITQDKKEAQKYFKLGGDNGHLLSMYNYTLTLLNSKSYFNLQNEKGICYLKKLIDLEFQQAITFFWSAITINYIKEGGFQKKFNEYDEYEEYEEYEDNEEEEEYSIIDMDFKIIKDSVKMPPKDIKEYMEKALAFIEKESNNGNVDIIFFYIAILNYGLCIHKNSEKADYYLRKLVDLGNPEAMVQFGIKCKLNNNLTGAFKFFKMAAKKGNKTGAEIYKDMLYEGEIFQKNPYMFYNLDDDDLEVLNDIEKNGYSKLELVSESTCERMSMIPVFEDIDNSLNFFKDGFSLNYKRVTYSDEMKLLSTFKYYAKEGDIDSLYEYGNTLLEFAKSIESKSNAIKYIKEAADKGHIIANLEYGQMLYYGNYVKVNKKEAANYFKYAAENGEKQAMFYYGKMIFEKDTISGNSDEAISYIRMSADSGCPDAMTYLGQMILKEKIPSIDKNREIVK